MNPLTKEESDELLEYEVVKLINNIGIELNVSAQESVKFLLNNNKSAGTRIRKAMQNIKKLAQEVRVEVQTQKNEVSA
jgi:predicted SpoU family rRNA methylase